MGGTYVHGKELRDLKVTKGTGLTVGIASGNYNIAGIEGSYAGITNQAVTDNATNYIEMDNTGSISVNTTGFTAGKLHIAIVVTSGGNVSTITDKRTFVTNAGAGVGTAIWRQGTPTGTIDGSNTIFTLPSVPDASSLFLVLDGMPLDPGVGDDYSLSGSTITFTTAPATGSKLVYWYTLSTPVAPAATDGLLTTTGTVTVGTSIAPTAGQGLVAISPTAAQWANVYAHGLKNASGNVDGSSSSAPVAGQVPIATSPTTMQWSNPKLFLLETVPGTAQTVVPNTAYLANNASQVVFTLPASASVGDTFLVQGLAAGGWRISQGTGQKIIMDTTTSTTGVTGYIASTYRYNTVQLMYINTNTWKVIGKDGTLTIA